MMDFNSNTTELAAIKFIDNTINTRSPIFKYIDLPKAFDTLNVGIVMRMFTCNIIES